MCDRWETPPQAQHLGEATNHMLGLIAWMIGVACALGLMKQCLMFGRQQGRERGKSTAAGTYLQPLLKLHSDIKQAIDPGH